MREQHMAVVENSFLKYLNVDSIFDTIRRADYIFLFYVEELQKKSGQDEGVYLSDLAQALNMTIPQASRTARALQDQDLILWKTSSDKSRTYVQLTSNAIELMNYEEARMEEFYDAIVDNIDASELEGMLATMKKIAAIIDKKNKESRS